MPSKRLNPDLLTRQLRGRELSDVVVLGQRLEIHFTDGTTLTIELGVDGLQAMVSPPKSPLKNHDAKSQPTKRQFEYLTFIATYINRFGRAPAESDIERHFLVSAPTVNQMMHMLERRGFISRQAGVPRSIRLCIDLPVAR
jgi:hypothetical protein